MRAMAGRIVALFLAAALMALGGRALAETVQHRIDQLLPSADLLLPEGKGPFPVVIQMHGCGGKKPFQLTWAEKAREAGWAVLVVDSYPFRNISSFEAYAFVCTGLHLWGRERAGDLYAAMEWVRHQGWADPDHIAAAGWSHGGWSILDAMAMKPGEEMAAATKLSDLPAEPLHGLVGAFVVYPYVGIGSVARDNGLRIDASPRALVGTKDVIVGSRSVAKTLEKMTTPGRPVEVVILEGATHAFDEPDSHDFRVHYSPEITHRAEGLYQNYLREAAKRTSSVKPAG